MCFVSEAAVTVRHTLRLTVTKARQSLLSPLKQMLNQTYTKVGLARAGLKGHFEDPTGRARTYIAKKVFPNSEKRLKVGASLWARTPKAGVVCRRLCLPKETHVLWTPLYDRQI